MSGDPAGLAAEVADAQFETWGRDAFYSHENSGVTLPCVVMTDSGDRNVNPRGTGGISLPLMQGNVFKLRRSEVPQPLKDAVITRTEDDGSTTRWRILSAPKTEDFERVIYRFTVEPFNE